MVSVQTKAVLVFLIVVPLALQDVLMVLTVEGASLLSWDAEYKLLYVQLLSSFVPMAYAFPAQAHAQLYKQMLALIQPRHSFAGMDPVLLA
jgi:hypothetical protein